MPGHDDFETAIEQRRHGALDPEGAARLDEHLASCSACGAFATVTTQTENEMRQQAAAAIEGLDWSWIEKSVVEWRTKTRRSFWIGVISTLAVLPSLLSHASAFGYVASVGLAIGVVMSYRHHRRTLVESHDAESSHGSLLQFYRERVDREIVVRRRGLAFLVAFAIAIVAVAFTMRFSFSTRVFAIGIATMFVAGGAWSAFVKIPRLRREHAALD
jgi:predicted anti-sigma-YlaC factor YlaD